MIYYPLCTVLGDDIFHGERLGARLRLDRR
jgi:hypothetical protein